MNTFISQTPEPPYYAVIFSNARTEGDRGYNSMAERMEQMASNQPGYLGIESVRNSNSDGITVSYWESEAAILSWKQNVDHQQAQEAGKSTWYKDYKVRIAKVERAYGKD